MQYACWLSSSTSTLVTWGLVMDSLMYRGGLCDGKYVMFVKDGLLINRQMPIESLDFGWVNVDRDSCLLKEDILVNNRYIEKIHDGRSLLKLFDRIVLSFRSRQRRP